MGCYPKIDGKSKRRKGRQIGAFVHLRGGIVAITIVLGLGQTVADAQAVGRLRVARKEKARAVGEMNVSPSWSQKR